MVNFKKIILSLEKFVVMKIFLILFVNFSISFAQIDIKQLRGSWYVDKVEQAANSKSKVEQHDLEYAKEILKDGYMHFSDKEVFFVTFEGDLNEDMGSATNFSYDDKSKSLKFYNSDGSKQENELILKTLTSSRLVYQVHFEEGTVEYHFLKAKPEHLICGSWLFSDLSITEGKEALGPDEEALRQELEELLKVEFETYYYEFYPDGAGYVEFPLENQDLAEDDFNWQLVNNVLTFLYSDGQKETVEVVSIQHGLLKVLISAEMFDIIVTFKRI